MSNKKGQIYILTAIIIGFVIFVLSATINEIREKRIEGDFKGLSEKYVLESTKLMNSLFGLEEEYIFSSFQNFTYLYTSYTKSLTQSFGVIYALTYKNKIQIGNYMDGPILVDVSENPYIISEASTILLNGCYDKLSTTITFEGLLMDVGGVTVKDIEPCTTTIDYYVEKIWINIEDVWYPFNIARNRPQIMMVSRLEEKEQRKVYVGGEGFTAENKDKEKVEGFCDKHGESSCEALRFCTWDREEGECIPVWKEKWKGLWLED